MLSFSRWVVSALLILNVLVGVPLLAVLGYSFVAEPKFLETLGRLNPGRDLDLLLLSARWILAIVAPVMLFAHILLRRLQAILQTVRDGEPFAPANAERLRLVAWCLLAIQFCDLGFGFAATTFDTVAGERTSGWSPGITGWVAVLLVFVLARVFREGSRLRDEAELTI
ncbi:DUF2975 domain-containing protein [Sphingomonas glaciei]|uniref:DUF2975 domain-containing protein n=1 Tax=Sphingomonas glaciei TaxID=2938948 RepID=A0ABY5MV49_9SPHN|nr:DUF2975 domain-containing protein [Sphingomonas glaciei]UUR07859.1 DUF2975 domain-containing protein [Sphingomonas glaciei]